MTEELLNSIYKNKMDHIAALVAFTSVMVIGSE